ncbi:cytochrome P450 [Stipitochalara longipes BDJ]|nr:cytochrome P450 [Stipitochalara longipes BDJ]
MSSETEILGFWPTQVSYQQLLRWTNLAVLVGFYYACKVIYRLYFSPLSHIPGRRLAAVTNLYACYYDLICGGQYIWEIEKMHQQYGTPPPSPLLQPLTPLGPIIRITPDEVHINDHAFIDTLFSGPGHQREKGRRTLNGLGSSPTAIGTRSHTLHKARRAALNPFFSSKNIRRLEPMVHEVLSQIFQRLDAAKNTGKEVNMSLLYRAATHDLIADYAFGQGSICFSREDLNQPYFQANHEMILTWYVGCYMPWFSQVVRKLPVAAVKVLVPTAKLFIDMIQTATDKIKKIKEGQSKGEFLDSERQTIFHGLLSSSLPEPEKDPARLAEEASVLLAAGTDSSANTLSAITFHLLSSPRILQKLRKELETAIPDKNVRHFPSFSQVEQLPYLSAIIQEGLRRHPAVSGRQQRVAPSEDLVYTSPTGIAYPLPRGTTMSMNPVLLSRKEDIYPNPGEFRPERFIENPRLRDKQFTFSRGSRMCLGMQLAYQEMYVILAGLFGRFDGGEGGEGGEWLQLYKTDLTDVEIVRDLVTENIRDGSVGVRVLVKGC